ncbi:HugZ family protein [Consotaella salsifontis]|uniref:Pyridoxamine 5'-phosphate oxidase N-terminal domain-containing protein n=1 Tax=Consotaella salsifontis TaxID=1365950 RepID=A0A1T4NVV3_9HYPH|nr:pyridoxamine 5'-phosphate oxidase family protein [Consotaella salsifontis]SJZ82878.1 hypothetical protein SAMN05428963_103195 [Consotaella salsifontis]
MTNPPDDVLRSLDDDARLMAQILLRTARHASLATVEPETGYPMASRVAVATDADGAPTLLVSSLAPHTAALANDSRCSLLFGEPGKGDPLAHPRLTVSGRAELLASGDPRHARVRRRFLSRHRKSTTYADFGDFSFVAIAIERARLNGGFARAYALSPDDLCASVEEALAEAEADIIDRLSTAPDVAANLASRLLRSDELGWRVATLDPTGFEMMLGDRIERIVFSRPARTPDDYDMLFKQLLDSGGEEASE